MPSRNLYRSVLTMLWSLLSATAVSAGSLDVFVVNDKGDVVEGAVVYLVSPAGEPKPGTGPHLVDQVDKSYVPHVSAVPVGAQVNFPNSDNIRHHVYSFSKAKKFEIPLYEGVPAKPITLDKPGVVALGCNIHDWMSGYIFVSDNPWYAITDAQGKAKINNIPDGPVEVEVWHEALRGSPKRTRKKLKLADSSELQFTIRQKKVFSAFRGAASRGSGYR